MNKIKNFNQSKVIEKIESELLLTFFNYVVPFINKEINIKAKQKEQNEKTKNLENIVNEKPKIDFKDVEKLESLLLKSLSNNVRASKSFDVDSNNLVYSFSLTRKKNEQDASNFSVSIKYEENEAEDRLKMSIRKDEKEVYSAETKNRKDAKDRVTQYSIEISYANKYGEERLSITYRQQLKDYIKRHIESKEDTSNRVPLKWLNIFPESMMGSVLGFTYLGDNSMGRRADLTGSAARMVDIHESIHTPDEYETRVLTAWIMEKVRGKYIK